MPATDPADQSAARELESALRATINRRERPPVELAWFLALPKRIRRSGQLLETAQAESRVLLEYVRADWVRTQQAERDREERLERAKALPRDLECLRAPEQPAWQGVGRRKQRCRRFNSIGRAFSLRSRLAPSAPAASPSNPVSLLSVDVEHSPSPPSTPGMPTRPPTPEGLRDAAFSCVGLLASASGVNAYGSNTPCPMPPVPARIIRCAPSPVPPPHPGPAYPGETVVNGVEVDWRVAYVIALGRHARYPHRPPTSLRAAAENVLDVELLHPGVLDCLSQVFFPHGFDDWSTARPGSMYLLDFCAGWYELAPR
ncbi:hypothetical protein FRC12_005027 [Ceratobasidium sp. 428]|nr:hypothetical protein FRC12_005027 [Ceratobasidium sp. 428]